MADEEKGKAIVEGADPHTGRNTAEEKGKAKVEGADPHTSGNTAEEKGMAMVEGADPHTSRNTAEEKGKAKVEGADPHTSRNTAEEEGMAEVEYDSSEDASDPCLWSRDLDEHAYGQFSIAAAQANEQMEDQSQVEAGRNTTAVGVYDGHGGPEASQFLCDHLFNNILREARKDLSIMEKVLTNAIKNTEEGFITYVAAVCSAEQRILGTGSCCVVGVIWNERLYVANLGDSRAVLGCLDKSNRISAVQLTEDHVASNPMIREHLMTSHHYDKDIVVEGQDGVYRIKGKTKVSRAIGDAYLKDNIFVVRNPEFKLAEPIKTMKPVVSDVPQIINREIEQTDNFIIFATNGFWVYLSNEMAVLFVHHTPREGIARRLVETALTVAMHRSGRGEYSLLKTIEKGPTRRSIHDDISVVVLFIDHSKMKEFNSRPGYSIQAFRNYTPESKFAIGAAPVELNEQGHQRC